MTTDIETKVAIAQSASIPLASVPGPVKDMALKAMASSLDLNRDSIIAANKLDVEAAEKLFKAGKLSHALVNRLKVDTTKIDEMIAGINDVITFEDP
ncbi:MAG: gamma-glutamyl-phosphate reductase, partial [ANME-2 cluster archaeon]|nr:gamma-glutamyl-phosphate reductase [ANME-2 cluster archaeon]